MSRGKSILLASLLAVLCQAGLLAGEENGINYHVADGATSLRKNAVVAIGGEVATDYSYRSVKTTASAAGGTHPPIEARIGDLSVKNANLRIQADVHPNVTALFKIDLSSNDRAPDEILEEAMLVMSAVGGTGLGFFAGQGRAPYGQDVTLGMLQSYHHTANRTDSSQGQIFLTELPEDRKDPGDADAAVPSAPMRPGQFERVFLAGASYEWQDCWKVEVAAFKPDLEEYRGRLVADTSPKHGSHIGAAARVWWRPFEALTLQLSFMAARSPDMARTENRRDVAAGVGGASMAYAISAGFDWKRGPWRLFGEYQHGRDWNFTKGYDTDAWQIGAGREIAGNWRVGGMVEGLHIDDSAPRERVRTDYYKLALNVRYNFRNGMFVVAEYGHEWKRRSRAGRLAEKRRGDFAGVRFGLAF